MMFNWQKFIQDFWHLHGAQFLLPVSLSSTTLLQEIVASCVLPVPHTVASLALVIFSPIQRAFLHSLFKRWCVTILLETAVTQCPSLLKVLMWGRSIATVTSDYRIENGHWCNINLKMWSNEHYWPFR